MALKQQIFVGGQSRRLAGSVSAPAVALRTSVPTQIHSQFAPARVASPAAAPAAPLLAPGFHAPTAPVSTRGLGSPSHVCSATRTPEKEIEFDVTVSVEEVSLCRRRVSITVPTRAVKDVFKRGVQRIERDVVGGLKGFQAGKPLPLGIVISKVGGPDNFKTYCLEELLLEALPRGVDKASAGKPVDPASVEVPAADFPAMKERYDPAKEFTFTANFDVAPPVVWRTRPEDITVTIQDTGDYLTDAAAADDLIRQYRKKHGFSRVVASRGLEVGDTLVMDMQIWSKATELTLPGLTHTRISFDTEQDVLGITEGMLGMKVGETRTFEMKLPGDYSVEFWQDMPVKATIKVHEIFEWTIPEFDDAYVQQHHAGQWQSAKDMRDALIAATAMKRVQLIDKALEDEVLKAVAAAVDMPEVPPRMVEQLGERQFQAQLLQMIEDRIGTQEDIAKLATEEMAREYITERKKDLEDQVRFNLAVDDLFASRALTLDEDTIRTEYGLRVRQMEAVGQPYEREELLDDVRETVKNVTVIEWLKDNVKREVLPYNHDANQQGSGPTAGEQAAWQGEPVAA